MANLKTLLVENSKIVLQIEKRYLKDTAVTIYTAHDGEEALKVARNIRPELVYLAFSLPGMNGADCCKAFKSDPELSVIPVVMVCTAGGGEPDRCLAAGCDAIVAKPLDRREFLSVGSVFLSKMAQFEDRFPCRATVACSYNDATFYGTIEDVCSTGMFVGCSRKIVPGDQLVMKFVLPWSGAALIETGAQVVWVNSGKRLRNSYLPPGFGVIFQGLKEEAAEQVKDYMELIRLRLHG
jgi:CheY-like chemotaxis protein